MKCPKCNTELENNATVCPNCGADNSTENSVRETAVKPRGFSSKKNIIIIILAAVLALGGGIAAVAVGVSHSAPQSTASGIQLAERYLSELNYEQAVIEYQRVLEIEPRNVDAYLGLAEAYIGMGDTEKAVEILRDGLGITSDSRLQTKIDELTKPAESSSSSSSEDTASSSSSDTTSTPEVISVDKPKVEREYNRENRLIWEYVTGEDGITTETYYGELTDENGNVTGWGIIDKWVDRRDENGELLPISENHYDGNGYSEEILYNDRGDVIKEVWNDVDGSGISTYKYEYGPFGPVKSVVTHTYNYTNDGETQTDTYVYTTVYACDPNGRLISETETRANGSRRSYTEYKYDANGRRIEEHRLYYSGESETLRRDYTHTWKYNDAGKRVEYNLIDLEEPKDANNWWRKQFLTKKWNDAGKLIESTDQHVYDGKETSVRTKTYTYNENGYVVHETYTYTDGGETKTREKVTTWTREYDDLGRVILKTGYDEDGDFAGKTEYEY